MLPNLDMVELHQDSGTKYCHNELTKQTGGVKSKPVIKKPQAILLWLLHQNIHITESYLSGYWKYKADKCIFWTSRGGIKRPR